MGIDTDDIVAEMAIRNLIATMAHVGDLEPVEAYLPLLDPDVRWSLPVGDAAHGHDEFLVAARARRWSGIVGPGTATRHIVSTTAVEVTDDTARSLSYLQFLGSTDSIPVLSATGTYRDEFTRTNGIWRFCSRIAMIG